MSRWLRHSIGLILIALLSLNKTTAQNSLSLSFSSKSLTIIVGESGNFTIEKNNVTTSNALTVNMNVQHADLVRVTPTQFIVPASSDSFKQTIIVNGLNPGNVEVNATVSPSNIVDQTNLFVKILVANSSAIIVISITVGWLYFVAWSISFYPQIFTNFQRKSVVGLNFDFLALNMFGHTLYAIYNSIMYWNTSIQSEYFRRFPKGAIPVELNDVFFSIHASIITAFTISQCLMYERGAQRVSNIARGILSLYVIIIVVFIILAGTDVVHWLDFFNTCSYIKLSITLIKYVPQAVMNYRRKSTEGWSIGNIILDFTGGMLSMLQMMLNSYNYDDWASIFGDPTKFGLGLFSVLFDILFIIQHYFLYRNLHPYEAIPDSRPDETPDSDPTSNENRADGNEISI